MQRAIAEAKAFAETYRGKLEALAAPLKKTSYGQYLLGLLHKR